MSVCDPDVTRYGAMWDSPRTASAVLRATAGRFGATLADPSRVPAADLAAAVIGVDAWMCALRAESLDTPNRFGSGAVVALAASLTRSASGSNVGPLPVWARDDNEPNTSVPTAWFVAVEEWSARINEWGLNVSDVFVRAAADLALGSPVLQRMANLLLDCAAA